MPRYDTSKPIGIGDVIVTREGPWYTSLAIRIGAKLGGLPAFCNHVIIVHHKDDNGKWWGIEGRPGGVGWVELGSRLEHPLTNANVGQYKSESERYLIAVAAEGLLGVAYDWEMISVETRLTIAQHLRMINQMWNRIQSWEGEWKDGEIPAHVVCSSFADWAYEKVGLKNPGGLLRTRMTTPGHWDKFIMDKEWEGARGKDAMR